MAHIERGNNREYFSNQLSGNEISEGIKQVGQSLANSFNDAQNITLSANESKLANNQVDLSSEFFKKNNEINTKYQADPMNPDREKELAEAFNGLAEKYDINPICRGQWNQIKNNIYNNFKQYNSQWQVKQQQTNASTFLKNTYDGLMNQASMLGQNNAGIEEARLIFSNGIGGLKNGTIATLGETVVNDALNRSTHDFMTNYLTGMIQSSPEKVIALLNDKNSGVENDIGDSKTISILKQSAQQSLLRKTEVEAVDRVANYINNNHNAFQKAFDGTLSVTEAQNILMDPKVDRTMRNVLSEMLGYSSRADLYVDAETGKINSIKAEEEKRKAESKRQTFTNGDITSSGNLNELVIGNHKWTFATAKGKPRQPNAQEKEEIRTELYLRGSQLLNNVEGKTPQQSIRKIAEFQSQIAQASYFGLGQADYKKLMNTFVLPATQNIQEEAKKYNANISSWNPASGKYGYEQIDKYFGNFEKNLEKTKANKDLVNKEKALASVYYWSGLNSYCSQRGISMSQLFGLSREERGEIYKKCAKQAIDKAKVNTQTPELWFRSMNPRYVSNIRSLLPNQNANNVITNVAVATLNNPNMTDKDYQNIINREIKNEYAKLRTSNKSVVFGGNTKYDELINKYSMLYGIDPLLVKSVIKHESGFNPNARSGAGAGGLMQLMPQTASGLGCKNMFDPRQNISAGTKYLANLLNKFNGNIPLALAAYNAGPGAVQKYGNKIPPYRETQNYVKNIMSTYNRIKG